jgi:GNAT superfamily N-acetyltransferase
MEEMKTIRGDKRIREWQQELGSRVWPEFMQHDETVSKYWISLYEKFADYQCAVFEDEILLGILNSIPLCWIDHLDSLPDAGLDWAMEKANNDLNIKLDPNILVGVQILINPEFQGRGLSYKLLEIMKEFAAEKGLTHIALPVRPTLKWKYPLIPMDDYIHWKKKDGLPFDPWIRVHVKAGGKIISTCYSSMDISGTLEDWEAWTNKKFPKSGDYIIDEALVPVKIDTTRNTGHYMEPNVWIVHEIITKPII